MSYIASERDVCWEGHETKACRPSQHPDKLVSNLLHLLSPVIFTVGHTNTIEEIVRPLLTVFPLYQPGVSARFPPNFTGKELLPTVARL